MRTTKDDLAEQLGKAQKRIAELEQQNKWQADSLESFRREAGGFPSNCAALDAIRVMRTALGVYDTLEQAFWTQTKRYRSVLGSMVKNNGNGALQDAKSMMTLLDEQLGVYEGREKEKARPAPGS